MHMWIIWAAVLAGLALAGWAAARFLPRPQPASRSARSMGGMAMLTLGAGCARQLDSLAPQVQEIFDRLERELSAHRPDSAISLLAQRAGASPVALSPDAWQVLKLALHFDALSEGACDVTIAPLVRLWNIGSAPNTTGTPSEEAIREILKLVDSRRVVLGNRTAFLPLPGMAMDLGGIAKGYAVDRAYDFCLNAGIKHFLIDLSGNIRVCGRPQWGRQWQVGVRNPFERSRILGSITMRSGLALATSGNYERFVEIMGQRYAHIINPRTGWPAAGMAGVTVLSQDATTADGLSTALFVLGLEGCGKLLGKAPPAEVLMVPDRYPVEIWLSRGLAASFVPRPEFASAVRVFDPGATKL